MKGKEASDEGTHPLFCCGSNHETGDVDEEDERYAALFTQLNELRRLQGRGREEDAIVGNLESAKRNLGGKFSTKSRSCVSTPP